MSQNIIDSFTCSHFRNLKNSIVHFSPTINCIFGLNGNGKTNLLEAIYYSYSKKSFRKNTNFSQMLSFEIDNPEMKFSSVFIDSTDTKNFLSVKVGPNNHEAYLNNSPNKKRELLPLIFINPFDSNNFHQTPSFRRAMMDQLFSKVDRVYKATLSKYQKALRQRNALLKNQPPQILNMISAIDDNLAQYSYQILQRRIAILEELNTHIPNIFKEIFSQEHQLKIDLDSKFMGMSASQIYENVRENLDKDRIIGHTTRGIHKDDYVFYFDGLNSFDFCSLGQQKMSFIALQFAYIELFRYKLSTYPIVLMDDVSGELDQKRWEGLVTYLQKKKFQILITTANENFRNKLESISEAKKFFVEDGCVEEIQ